MSEHDRSASDARPPEHMPAQQQEWPGHGEQMSPEPDYGETGYTGHERLAGKRALITGGDSGIGRAIATLYAHEGADVAIAYLPQEQRDAEQVRSVVEGLGRRCILIACDQRSEQANQELVAEAVDHLGGLDVVISNAAFQMGSTTELEDLPSEQLQQVVETNLYATFWLLKAAVPHLGEGASILITASIQAYQPSPPLLDYAATKAALTNLTVNLAGTLGSRGIRVNAVAPGPIWTPLIPSTFGPGKVDGFGTDTPLGRPGQPVEVATAYVYLASPDASYVSGTVLGVTGGKPVF